MLYYFIIPVIHITWTYQSDECPGDAAQFESTATENSGFFISENPVGCSGDITAWRFCYYTNTRPCRLGSYEAAFGLYRKQGEDFELLSYTEQSVSKDGDSFTDNAGLTCELLELSTPYNIEEGYHIGVCLFEDGNDKTNTNKCNDGVRPLSIIAQEVTGTSLKHSDSYCDNSLPIIVQTEDSLDTLHDHALHISLQVGEYLSSVAL